MESEAEKVWVVSVGILTSFSLRAGCWFCNNNVSNRLQVGCLKIKSERWIWDLVCSNY